MKILPLRSINRPTSYRYILQFVDLNGEQIEIEASINSNPPIYSQGEKVQILYRPNDQLNAKTHDIWDLWFGVTITGILGVMFFSIGFGIILVQALRSFRDRSVRKHGIPIETEVHRVELNESVSLNDIYPYRILTRWQDPSTSKMYLFQSDNVWFDPSEFVRDRRITVFIARNNPKRHYVDLSFLPEPPAF